MVIAEKSTICIFVCLITFEYNVLSTTHSKTVISAVSTNIICNNRSFGISRCSVCCISEYMLILKKDSKMSAVIANTVSHNKIFIFPCSRSNSDSRTTGAVICMDASRLVTINRVDYNIVKEINSKRCSRSAN